MKKMKVLCIALMLMSCIAACSATNETEVTGDTGITEEANVVDNTEEAETTEIVDNTEEAETTEESKTTELSEQTNAVDTADDAELTDEVVLTAITNYCYDLNPDLKDMVDSGDYEIYWDVDSSDENEIVILYRSYTAAEVRYYVNRTTGETYVTEYVEGITPEEERTEESFNVRDYIK